MAAIDFDARRAHLLEEIAADVRATVPYLGFDRLSPRVMGAIGAVPREAFVDPEMAGMAYANRPLPIGDGQTISQPYIVALMTHLIAPEPHHRVLEIGAGCGYQAAVVARLVAEVVTIERHRSLAQATTRRLADLGIGNVTVHQGDGFAGWPDGAPYDGILVTAAPVEVPAALLHQLRPGGRMAIPVGRDRGRQMLVRVTRWADGSTTADDILPVRFVPMLPGLEGTP